jgi:hypothetical protein
MFCLRFPNDNERIITMKKTIDSVVPYIGLAAILVALAAPLLEALAAAPFINR